MRIGTLFVVALFLGSVCLSQSANKLDIIQIDVGNEENFVGLLNLPPNTIIAYPNHGTDMARTLYSQLASMHGDPVNAIQVVWNYPFEDDTDAVLRALKLSPKILSMSLSGKKEIKEESDALTKANNEGILIVAAAGNHLDKVSTPTSYPAALPLPCMVSVATSKNGHLTWYSNEGEFWLDQVGDEPGTSYSTARMAGIAAVLWQKYPNSSCEQIKEKLKQYSRRPK